jgi:dTDP-4-dehydrorhamnose reductase
LKKNTILVTGANGQLGMELAVLSKEHPDFQWIFTDRSTIDLANLENIESKLASYSADILINCAAYTAVDKAESEVDLADQINHLAVGKLSDWCFRNTCKFIHISTDYVFDGTSSVALREDAATAPLNVYGQTKRAGEELCLVNNPDAIILRTSWVYSEFGNNFVKTMKKLMHEREELNIVNDQIGSPTYANDLARAIIQIIQQERWHAGIYHYSNEGELSWFEFAVKIKELLGSTCKLNGIPTEAYPTPAKRPKFSLLDKEKLKETFNAEVPHYLTSLTNCLSKIN